MSEPIYKFDLSQTEANVVMAGLAELPAKHSYDLINKMKGQAASQQVPPTPAVAEAAPAGQQLLTEDKS